MTVQDRIAGLSGPDAEVFLKEILRTYKDSDPHQALNLYLSGLQSLFQSFAFTPATPSDTRSFATGGLAAIDAIRNTLQLAFISSPVTNNTEENLGDDEEDKAAEAADSEVVY